MQLSEIEQQQISNLLIDLLPPLKVATPSAWCEYAADHLELLIVDHAHCEKKAASSALNLIYRYPDNYNMVQKMSRLAREELRHMEQVIKLGKQHNIAFRHYPPSRYAAQLAKHVRTFEPCRAIDSLLLGALIEARSCERFAVSIPYLPTWLGRYYFQLLKSESRHYHDYVELAAELAAKSTGEDVLLRLAMFAEIEAELIRAPDHMFHFHSGVPA